MMMMMMMMMIILIIIIIIIIIITIKVGQLWLYSALYSWHASRYATHVAVSWVYT